MVVAGSNLPLAVKSSTFTPISLKKSIQFVRLFSYKHNKTKQVHIVTSIVTSDIGQFKIYILFEHGPVG